MALHRNDPQVEGKDACYRCVTKPMETVILLSSCYTEILEAGKNYRGHSCLLASGPWCGRRLAGFVHGININVTDVAVEFSTERTRYFGAL